MDTSKASFFFVKGHFSWSQCSKVSPSQVPIDTGVWYQELIESRACNPVNGKIQTWRRDL